LKTLKSSSSWEQNWRIKIECLMEFRADYIRGKASKIFYHLVQNFPSSSMPFKKVKIKIYGPMLNIGVKPDFLNQGFVQSSVLRMVGRT